MSSHDVSFVHVGVQKKRQEQNPEQKNQDSRQVGEAANSPCGSLLCLPLPALEDWACKKFQLQGLRPASIGTVSKKKKKKRNAEGTSLRRECWLFALSPATLRLSLWDSGGALTALSAPRVTPVHSTALWLAESVLKKLPSPLETDSEKAGNVLQDFFPFGFSTTATTDNSTAHSIWLIQHLS